MSLHVRPFTRQNAIHHAVTYRSVAAGAVMTDNAILLGPQGLNRSLRGKVEIIGAQTHHLAPQRIECVTEQQQLAASVDMAALPALGIPGVTDLDPINRRYDVMVAGAADDRAAGQLPYHPGE